MQGIRGYIFIFKPPCFRFILFKFIQLFSLFFYFYFVRRSLSRLLRSIINIGSHRIKQNTWIDISYELKRVGIIRHTDDAFVIAYNEHNSQTQLYRSNRLTKPQNLPEHHTLRDLGKRNQYQPMKANKKELRTRSQARY